jgi:c-di-GMP-binding flagellar brake protein YcgR
MPEQENTVPFVDAENFEERMKYTRAVSRINSRVNLAVEWTEEGRALRTEGFTVDVSAGGCLAIVPQGFTVGQKLRVVNLLNNKVSDAVLIWRGHEGRQGWELGLQLVNTPEGFWGIEL